jgi:hypothetical protein
MKNLLPAVLLVLGIMLAAAESETFVPNIIGLLLAAYAGMKLNETSNNQLKQDENGNERF